jgi:hypothetical protein
MELDGYTNHLEDVKSQILGTVDTFIYLGLYFSSYFSFSNGLQNLFTHNTLNHIVHHLL